MEKTDKEIETAAEVDDSEEAFVLDSDDDDDDDDVARLGSGYIRRGVYPICASKLCGNDFSAVKDNDKFSSMADGSSHSDPFSQKHHEYSYKKDVVEAFSSQCNEHMNIGDNKTKITQGLSQVSTRIIVDEDNISEISVSQETEDLSQANALGFVDHYISMNNMHFLDKDTPGRTNKLISPLVSSAKGSQKLAKRAIIGTSYGLSKNFEWDDEVDDIEKNVLQNKDMNTKSNGSKPRYVKDSCNKKLMRENTCTEFSIPLVENYKAFDEVSQVSKMNIEEVVPDSYDVGFDTQMAAEAMEALFYAPPSNFSGNLPHQNAGNITGNSLVAKEAHSNSVTTKRKCKQKHGSSKKLNGQTSEFSETNRKELNTELLKPKIGEKGKRLNSLIRADNSFTEQGKKSKSLDKDDIKRRQNNKNAELLQISPVKGKRSNTSFFSPGEAGNIKECEKQPKNVNLNPVDWHPRLDMWSFPKGKRKNRKARHQLDGLSLFKGESGPSSSFVSSKRSEDNSINNCLKVYVRRKKRSNVHDHQVQSVLELNSESVLRQNSRNSCLKVYVRRKTRFPIHNHQVQSSLRQSSTNSPKRGLSSVNEEVTGPKMDSSLNLELRNSKNPLQVCGRKSSRVPFVKEIFNLETSDSGLTGESKPLRRRRDMKNVQVLFSQNMDDTIIQKQKKILERLGSFVTSSCSEATHFVADRFVRTKNMLEAIALGKPVVTHMWIVSCGQAKFFVDEKNYLLRDVKKEKEFGFTMPVSLASARKAPLLKGRRVFVTPNINPGKELIVSLIKAVKGEVLSEAVDGFYEADRNAMISDDLLILSCEQDYALCAPFLEQGASIYSSELLLNGIVTQKLEFERHRLFENHFQNESFIM